MASFADRVQETTTATSTTTIALGGAVAKFRSFATAFAVGTVGIPVCVADSGNNWEIGLYTLTSATLLTRTAIASSSNSGSPVSFPAGSKNVFCTVGATQLGDFLTSASLANLGTPLSQFLADNAGSSVAADNLVLAAQNGAVKGITASSLAQYINTTFQGGKEVAVVLTNGAALPLDFSTHNRRRLIFKTPATLNAPSVFSSVGNDFFCKVTNISGGVVTLGTGINGLPSGNTIPNGTTAEIFTSGGFIYAQVFAAASGGGTTPPVAIENPFEVYNRNDFPTQLATFTANYMWSDIYRKDTTNGPTAQSVKFAVSTSSTVKPTSSISNTTSPAGRMVDMIVYGEYHSYITEPQFQFNWNIASDTVFYAWIIITDSNGAVWYWRQPDGSSITVRDFGPVSLTSGSSAQWALVP